MSKYATISIGMNISKHWLWAQYSPGAGGKMLCTILQLSPKVHSWYDDIRNNFDAFIEKKVKIPAENHLKLEPHAPYKISWFTRQLPFRRGDDIDPADLDSIWNKENLNYDKLITMHYCKPYFPKWFQGKAIRIINDKDSLSFLQKRRDAIFYKWEGNKVWFKRFVQNDIHNKHLVNRFKDDPPDNKIYTNMDDFYKEEFENNPEIKAFCEDTSDQIVCCSIELSDILNIRSKKITEKINRAFDLEIDSSKVQHLLDVWVDHNKKFIE
jgi:hypothetical protein